MAYQNEYFATRNADELAKYLCDQWVSYYDWTTQSKLQKKWIKSYHTYYGKHFQGTEHGNSEIQRGGAEGELFLVSVNHYRNLLKHVLIMATAQRTSFDIRAINSDVQSMQQARLANSIIESYFRERRFEDKFKQSAEMSLVFGKGFIELEWDKKKGTVLGAKSHMTEEGEEKLSLQYDGDVTIRTPSVFDVNFDQSCESWDDLQWITTRRFLNKFDLAARYQDKADDILALQTKTEAYAKRFMGQRNPELSADVPVFYFYHKRSDSMPNGRFVKYCEGGLVLEDLPMPYRKLPVFMVTPGVVYGSVEGYTEGFDILGLQEVLNTLLSTAYTNNASFGVQRVLVPEGSNISVDQVSTDLAFIKYNPQAGEPKALQLTATPPELFKLFEMVVNSAEILSGINSVTRGQPNENLKSGTALALVQSMAVQFSSGFQSSYANLCADGASFIIDLLKDFADSERMIALAGKNSRQAMKSFKGEDLKNIDRVIVSVGNPFSKTTAGALTIADSLLEKGMISTPQEYINVLNSGNIDPLLQSEQAELDLIHNENEAMLEGRPVPVLMFDKHLLHAQEHKAILSNPEIRMSEELSGLVLSHIQEHINAHESKTPTIAAIIGEPMGPPPAPEPGPGPGPQLPQNEPMMPVEVQQMPDLPEPAQAPQIQPAQ